jgi:hypothetical protein
VTGVLLCWGVIAADPRYPIDAIGRGIDAGAEYRTRLPDFDVPRRVLALFDPDGWLGEQGEPVLLHHLELAGAWRCDARAVTLLQGTATCATCAQRSLEQYRGAGYALPWPIGAPR